MLAEQSTTKAAAVCSASLWGGTAHLLTPLGQRPSLPCVPFIEEVAPTSMGHALPPLTPPRTPSSPTRPATTPIPRYCTEQFQLFSKDGVHDM